MLGCNDEEIEFCQPKSMVNNAEHNQHTTPENKQKSHFKTKITINLVFF